MAFWLMKSEPDTFSIDDLVSRPGQTEPWDGVRNYQARNFLRAMTVGDQAFFYHSNCAEPGIVGIVRIAAAAYPDRSQWNAKSPYYDPRSSRQEPRWSAVDVRFERKLARTITLAELRAQAQRMPGFKLLAPGSRLSVMPVSADQWRFILGLEHAA